MKKQRKDFLYTSLILTGILLLSSLYYSLWKMQITTPNISSTADFIAFYTAGKIANAQSPSRVYELQEQLRVQIELREDDVAPSDLLSYNHLPFLIPILQAITTENYPASFARWGFLLFVFSILNTIILLKILPIKKSFEKLVVFVGIILFFPSFISILKGQDTLIMLLGASLWTFGLLQRRDSLAGIGLSLVTLRPHIALVLAIPFIFKRRKIFLYFIGSSSILMLFSVALIGVKGSIDFIDLLLLSSRGEGYYLNPGAMYNLVGVVARGDAIFSYKALENISWIGFGIAIFFLSMLWKNSQDIKAHHIGTAIILSLFFAPHLHYHDLALLLIPFLLIINRLLTEEWVSEKVGGAYLIGISVILFTNYYLPTIYLLSYILMFCSLLFFWQDIFFRRKFSLCL